MVERTVVDQRANCSRRGVIMLVDSWSVVGGVEVVDGDGFPGVKCGLVEFNGRYRTRTATAQLTRRGRVLGSSPVFGQLFRFGPLLDKSGNVDSTAN